MRMMSGRTLSAARAHLPTCAGGSARRGDELVPRVACSAREAMIAIHDDVPGAGLEPARAFAQRILSSRRYRRHPATLRVFNAFDVEHGARPPPCRRMRRHSPRTIHGTFRRRVVTGGVRDGTGRHARKTRGPRSHSRHAGSRVPDPTPVVALAMAPSDALSLLLDGG